MKSITLNKLFCVLLFAVIICAVMSVNAFAADTIAFGYCGGDTAWEYDSDSGCYENLEWTLDCDGLLSITGMGEMKNFSMDAPWINYCDQIMNVSVDSNVTSIGDSAFTYCINLESVSLPERMEYIGESAFQNCESMKNITLPQGLERIRFATFANCYALKEVIIPEGVTVIEREAIFDCFDLELISIPSSVENIEPGEINPYLFNGCKKLVSITVDDNNQYFCSDENGVLFNKDKSELLQYPVGNQSISYSIPESVKVIGTQAFDHCTTLTDITFPTGLTDIGIFAFDECNGLTTISLPDSVVNISGGAFCGCENLTKVALGIGVKTIGESTFSLCENLIEVSIPGNVTSIGSYAFDSCISLARVIFGCNAPFSFNASFNDSCVDNFAIHAPKNNATWTSDSAYNADEQTWNGYPIVFDVESPLIVDFGYCGASTDGKNLVWKLYDSGELLIVGEGRMADYINGSEPWFSYNEQIKSITVGDDIINIGSYAFYGCNNLISVDLSEGLTSIGVFAFYNCSSLAGIILPNDLTNIEKQAFYNCISLKEITIPQHMTCIANVVFGNCINLEIVTLPKGLISIENLAFNGCTGIKTVYYAGSETQWGMIEIGSKNECLTDARIICTADVKSGECGDAVYWSLSNDGIMTISGIGPMTGYKTETPWNMYNDQILSVYIDSGVTNVASYAFCDCSNLKSISLSNTVTSIDEHAFYNCSSLSAISFPDSVDKIEYLSFGNCTSLVTVSFPDDLTGIYSNAFNNTPWLNSQGDFVIVNNALILYQGSDTEVEIPYRVTIIGDSAFRDNETVKKVIIPNGVKRIGPMAFYACSNLSEIDIPSSVKYFGDDAFGITKWIKEQDEFVVINDILIAYQGYHGIPVDEQRSYVTLPNGIKEIAAGVFNNCQSIESIRLSDEVESIGDWAFVYCKNLKTIYLPGSLTSIENYIFDSCDALQDIYFGGNESQWENLINGVDFHKSLEGVSVHFCAGICGDNAYLVFDYKAGKLAICGSGDIFVAAYSTNGWMQWVKNVSVPVDCFKQVIFVLTDEEIRSYDMIRIYFVSSSRMAPICEQFDYKKTN